VGTMEFFSTSLGIWLGLSAVFNLCKLPGTCSLKNVHQTEVKDLLFSNDLGSGLSLVLFGDASMNDDS